MMIAPWRSAKCPGTSFHPSAPNRYGPPMSSRSARHHSAIRSVPDANAASTSSPTPIAVLSASPVTDLRSAPSSRLASVNSAMWAARTAP